MSKFTTFIIVFALCLSDCVASKIAKIYCPSLFQQLCPMKEGGNLEKQLQCIIDLYEKKKLVDFDVKCTKLAIGMYQTQHLGDSKAVEFDQPSQCSSVGNAGLWNENNKLITDIDFTLVSQCSADRLWMVGEMCKVSFKSVFFFFHNIICV